MLLAVSLTFFSSSLFADDSLDPVRLFSKEKYPLNLHMQVLEDKSNALTIDQVASIEYAEKFINNDQLILNLGISKSTYWFRFALIYPDAYPNKDSHKRWYLEAGSPALDVAELFISEANGIYEVKKSDGRTDYSGKELAHANSVFPLDMQIGQEQTFYVKIKNETSAHIPLTLWTPEGFVAKTSKGEFIYGLLLGGMLALIIYNIFIYISVRDISYFYYVIYFIGLLVFCSLESGRGLLHLDTYFGAISRGNLKYIIWFVPVALFYFVKHFMDTAQHYPKIDKALNIAAMIAFISLILSPFFDYTIATRWNMIYMMILLPSFSGMLIYCWMKGNDNAKYFFLAWFFNVLGLFVLTGVTLQVIPATPLTLAASQIGIALEALTLSFALAHRIKTEQARTLDSDAQTMAYLSHYQSIFDNAREGMYKMSLNGVFISVNPAMVKMFSFSDSIKFMSRGRKVSMALFESPEKQYKECVENGTSNNSLYFTRKDGKDFWGDHQVKLISDESGKPSHLEGTLIDVTQINLKERAVKEEQLERNKKEIAEETASAKSGFLSIMSHEIRTPLTAIMGFTESLKDISLSKEDKDEAIQLIVGNSHRLLQLINDILDLSKIEANKLSVEVIPVEITPIIDQLSREFSRKAHDKDIEFHVNYTFPFPSEIISDPTRIMQTLKNLCDNAIKFTEKGRVTLSAVYEKNCKKIIFTVTDTGIGMDENVVRNIFREFDQADVSASRQYEGAGLGLTIAKKLTLLMDGDIEVSSEPGRGSTFTISIDASFPDNVRWIDKVDSSSVKNSRLSSFIPNLTGTVLLAEDNIVNQKLIKKVLENTGVEVIIAADGVEACEYFKNATPDFVLMDINMPNKNGIEATKHIRINNQSVPIYALTAETNQEEINKVLEVGCNGFLSKPVNKTLLYSALAECLPRRDESSHKNKTLHVERILDQRKT